MKTIFNPRFLVGWLTLVVGLSLPIHSQAQSDMSIRLATYNVSLYGKAAGQIRSRLADGKDRQAERIASIIQTVRPDIVLLNEIDHDTDAATVKLLAEKFFAVGQGDLQPVDYPHIYSAPSNTGLLSGLDLDRDGSKDGPADAFGFGVYPGQYSMAVLSRFPIDESAIRTFQTFLWKDLPGAIRPIHPATGVSYYDDATWNALRLSSKNHIDVPIRVNGRTIHVLASHPTPPVFDGPEDRNGCRNHGEIDFWNQYIGKPQAAVLVDDQGRAGGLAPDALFFVAGDLNSDPQRGDSRREAIAKLVSHPLVNDPQPASIGAAESSTTKPPGSGGSAAGVQNGDPAQWHTADFGRSGNMRVDYVLPSRNLTVGQCGVFWPSKREQAHSLILASDHRLVWVDVELPVPGASR